MANKDKHLTLAELNKVLPEEVSKLYKFVNKDKRSSTKFMNPKFGLINLNTITVNKVKYLLKMKCPFFVKK